MTRPIRTEFVYPPIPLRDCDWLATFEDADETGPQGWGATREAAVADLLAQSAAGLAVNFDPKVLTLSDTEMLTDVWNWWVGYQIAMRGLHPADITDRIPEIAENIRSATVGIDPDQIGILWLSKALKEIATGQLDRAARTFRAGMANGAAVADLLAQVEETEA